MAEDKSMHGATDEQQADAAVSESEEVADAPKRNPAWWRRAVGFLGKVAVNLLIGGLPFFAAGVFLLSDDDLASQIPERAPWVVISVGAAIIAAGFFVSLVARPRLALTSGERVLEERHPSLKPPFVRMIIGVLLLAASGYMLWFTLLPYILPVTSFFIGMYVYLRGVATYWINHHTAYYATNNRVVHLYRFLWLKRAAIPIDSLQFAETTKSLIEILTGRGNVRVEGARRNVNMREIDNPDPMEQIINEMRARTRG